MHRERSALFAIALTLSIALAASPAAGDERKPSAEETFKQALAAYDAGHYREAIELYGRVYRETGAPAVLFNIAQAARQLGDCPRALAHYRRFVIDAPASPDRPRAETWIAELGDCGGAAPTTGPPPSGAVLTAPSLTAPPQQAPTSPVPATSPAPPTLTRSAEPTMLKPLHRPSRLPAVLAFAGAAALAGGGTFAAIKTGEAEDQISKLFQRGGDWDASAMAIDERGHRYQTWSVVLFSAAIAAAAAGVALLIRASRPSDEEP